MARDFVDKHMSAYVRGRSSAYLRVPLRSKCLLEPEKRRPGPLGLTIYQKEGELW